MRFPYRLSLSALALILAALPLGALAAGSGGVTGPAFYANNEVYRTVGTPTHHLSQTGAPAHSYDTIYMVGGGQMPVADAAPGDTDYNGGRWMVVRIDYNTSYAASLAAHDLNGNGVFDSDAEIDSALADAGATGATEGPVLDSFVCPVIKMRANGS
jgi:hypothetical protein